MNIGEMDHGYQNTGRTHASLFSLDFALMPYDPDADVISFDDFYFGTNPQQLVTHHFCESIMYTY